MNVCPLIFEPIFKPKIWGGRKLDTILGKSLPAGEMIGESWELADLEDDQSIVSAGSARGRTLEQLVKEWGTDLLGRAVLFEGRFPLLIKFLDANDTLSVQVHPDEATARRLGGRVRLKNEAWYVIDADANGCIYRGVNEGVDAEEFRRAVQENRIEAALKRTSVGKGDCYYLPSGTVHALGAGVLVAEVQTPSDITYRVYDWDRIDQTTGKPRELHLQQALECISYETGPVPGEEKRHVADVWTTVTSLVRCESFVIERIRAIEGIDQPVSYQEMAIWITLEGRASLSCAGAPEPLHFGVGSTVLLPAGLHDTRVQTYADSMWLEVTVPIPGPTGGPGGSR